MSQQYMFPGAAYKPAEGNKNNGEDGNKRRVIWDEKYFPRIDRSGGDTAKFRGWKFELLVSIGQVDEELGNDLKLILTKGHDDNCDPTKDADISLKLHDKCASELYGFIVSLTNGKAKTLVRGVLDSGI